MGFNNLVQKMAFHGFRYEDGIFYKPYESYKTVQAAEDWLRGLED